MYSISISTLYFELSHGFVYQFSKYSQSESGFLPSGGCVPRYPRGGRRAVLPSQCVRQPYHFTSINLSFRYIVFHPFVHPYALRRYLGDTIMCNVTDTVSIQGESYNLFMCFNQISSEVTRMGNWSLHFRRYLAFYKYRYATRAANAHTVVGFITLYNCGNN